MYRKLRDWMERTMTAVAFAEAGCWETARQIMDENKQTSHKRPSVRPESTSDNRPVLRM